MKHSIIIPHRGRAKHLAMCLTSIARSAVACGVPDHEVLVVEPEPGEMPVFNKSVLLNRGIRQATGDVLTFLDADAIVGREWLLGVEALADPAITRVCYRVRYLPSYMPDLASCVQEFADYDGYPLAWESWRHHDINRYDPNGQPWGNSQFSMRRENLNGLWYDEAYVGKGMEELDFMRQIERKFGDRYRAVLDTRPERCMFHLQHEYEPEWGDAARQIANCDRFVAGRNGEEQARAKQRKGQL